MELETVVISLKVLEYTCVVAWIFTLAAVGVIITPMVRDEIAEFRAVRKGESMSIKRLNEVAEERLARLTEKFKSSRISKELAEYRAARIAEKERATDPELGFSNMYAYLQTQEYNILRTGRRAGHRA